MKGILLTIHAHRSCQMNANFTVLSTAAMQLPLECAIQYIFKALLHVL
jgi:hypothetical protein